MQQTRLHPDRLFVLSSACHQLKLWFGVAFSPLIPVLVWQTCISPKIHVSTCNLAVSIIILLHTLELGCLLMSFENQNGLGDPVKRGRRSSNRLIIGQ